MKFIKLTRPQITAGEREQDPKYVYINTDTIQYAQVAGHVTIVTFTSRDWVEVEQTPEEILEEIAHGSVV